MFKKFLCATMAAVLFSCTFSAAPAVHAAKVPKAAYTFNMDKKSSKVIAVARKGDTDSFTAKETKDNIGVLPTSAAAKGIKLKYVKGKHGKSLFLDRTKSYGAQLKGIKLGSKSWTVSFWVKPSSSLSSHMPVFFTGSKLATANTNWVSITKTGEGWLNGYAAPAVWSRNTKANQWPWYAYQDEDGKWWGDGDQSDAMALTANKWSYVTVAVDTGDTCEYGNPGSDDYVKSYHAWTYINGSLYGNGTVAKSTMSNKNLFFLGINCWDCPFKGYFDDVQFWKKALSAKQVKKLYKSMK